MDKSAVIKVSRRQRACDCLFLVLIAIPLLFLPLHLLAKENTSYEQALAAYREHHRDKALSFAQAVVREEPENVEAYVLLGQLYYDRQELQKARENWERALKLSPSRQDIKEALDRLGREEPIESLLDRTDTYPFVVRFSEWRMPLDVKQLRNLLRTVYRLSGQQFRYFPNYPIPVIFYEESDFERLKGLSHKVGGLYDGKIRLPIPQSVIGDSLSASDHLERVLWHEYAHLIVHDLAKGRCPLWLNEGIAVFQEDHVASRSLQQFKLAFDAQKIISWEQLWTEQQYPAESVELRYEEAYLIVRYLAERWGWVKMVDLLHRLDQGYSFPDAFKAEYKLTVSLLEKQWREWVFRLLG